MWGGSGVRDGPDFCCKLVPTKDIEKQSRLDLVPLASSSEVNDALDGETTLLEGLGCEVVDGPACE